MKIIFQHYETPSVEVMSLDCGFGVCQTSTGGIEQLTHDDGYGDDDVE